MVEGKAQGAHEGRLISFIGSLQNAAARFCILAFLASSWFSGIDILYAQSLRPSLSSPTDQTRTQFAATGYDYNLKLGPAFLTLGTSLGFEYNDNINLANSSNTGLSAPKSDLIYRPAITLHSIWPVTKLNVLSFDLGLGVQRYLGHPEYNQTNVTVSPNTQLSFDLYVGNVRFNFHDALSISQNAATRADATNTGPYSELTNTAGVSALWDLNKSILQASYDYRVNRFTDNTTRNPGTAGTPDQTITITRVVRSARPAQPPQILPGGIIIPGTPAVPAKTVKEKQTIPGTQGQPQGPSQFNNSVSNIFNASIAFPIAAALSTGLQSNYILTTYDNSAQPDITTVSVGPFIQAIPTRYTRVQVSGGYQNSSYRYSTPQSLNFFASSSGSDQQQGGSFYYNLSVQNRLNELYQQSVTLSRERQLGLSTNLVQTSSLRYDLQWQINSRLAVGANAFYQVGEQNTSFTNEKFDYFGWGLSFGYQLTRHLSTGFHYTHTQRSSDLPLNGYSQNTVGLDFSYAF